MPWKPFDSKVEGIPRHIASPKSRKIVIFLYNVCVVVWDSRSTCLIHQKHSQTSRKQYLLPLSWLLLLSFSAHVFSSFFVSETDIFSLPALLFFVDLNQIFPRINNLTIQMRNSVLSNNYSYQNAVKRSINTSPTSLIILISGSRIRLHS